MDRALPDFVPPMLARLARQAFDSDEHLFEIKWDGIRALAFCEGGGYRLRSRRDNDLAPRYPELDFLAELPPGLVLDGELVVLNEDGSADISRVLQREQTRHPERIAQLRRASPVVFVVFDLLYVGGVSIMDQPLRERRAALEGVLAASDTAHLMLSDGLLTHGKALFEQVSARGVEGVVAKLLDSPYLAGQRTEAWTKIKLERRVHCVVLGFTRDDSGGLKSLIVGTDVEGGVRCVGKVGSGLTEPLRVRLLRLLEEQPADAPLVPCGENVGTWVAPVFYCTVAFLEFTRNGTLRAPVFVRWHEG